MAMSTKKPIPPCMYDIIRLVRAGYSQEMIAFELGIGIWYVSSYLNRWFENKELVIESRINA